MLKKVTARERALQVQTIDRAAHLSPIQTRKKEKKQGMWSTVCTFGAVASRLKPRIVTECHHLLCSEEHQ
jgi:hypothetical protein